MKSKSNSKVKRAGVAVDALVRHLLYCFHYARLAVIHKFCSDETCAKAEDKMLELAKRYDW